MHHLSFMDAPMGPADLVIAQTHQTTFHMKIAVITDAFPRVSELFIATQIVGLMERGHEVRIYASSRSDQSQHPIVKQHRLMEHATFADGCTGYGHLIRLLIRFWLRYPRTVVASLRHIINQKRRGESINAVLYLWGLLLPRQHFDVVHVHFGYNAVPLATLRQWGLLRESRLVVTFHGCDFMPRILPPDQYDSLFLQADALIHVTQFAMGEALKQGFPEAKMHLVPCGLNPELEQPLQRRPNANRPLHIAFVGRLIDLKKPITFIEIIAQLQQQGVNCFATLIGDGPLMEACQTRVAELGLDKVFNLTGACTANRVQALLAESDVFLFPGGHDASGRAENQGCVAQEAQAMGLPVVCTTVGGTHESVRQGHTGFILPEGDTAGMVERIVWLDSHREMLALMSRNARRHALQHYSNDTIIAKLEQIYTQH